MNPIRSVFFILAAYTAAAALFTGLWYNDNAVLAAAFYGAAGYVGYLLVRPDHRERI
jgi:hypothetical protein